MVKPIEEKPLKDFREFESWLDEKGLFNSNVLYRGHGESTWTLESTLYRHQRTLFGAQHPSINVPISTYMEAARKVQAIVETHTNQDFGEILTPGHHDVFPVRDVVVGCLSFRYAVYLRHHGFPSPLLDWSLSPYVAAYFAFVDATDRQDARNGGEEDESRVAIYVMRPPKRPYKRYTVGSDALPGDEAGIRYWPNPVKGETRHYDQQSAYTTALRAKVEDRHTYFFDSHEYILREFPQTLVPGTNLVTYEHAIDQVVCWKLTIPQRERERVLQRLDKMNINAYTLFRTEDTLVKTYGQRELHGTINAT